MMQFLEPISLSKYTLPVVSGVCILLWLIFRGEGDWEPILGGLLVLSFMVYLIAELNNRNALLRNGSRMHSCMAILLTTVIIQLHTFSFAHLMMISIIITMHLLCRTTLVKSPILSFLTYFILAVISIFYLENPISGSGLLDLSDLHEEYVVQVFYSFSSCPGHTLLAYVGLLCI